MRKILLVFFITLFNFMGFSLAGESPLSRDTSDPLYLPGMQDILSETALTYGHDILRAGQVLSYGLNDRLALGIDIHYQQDFSGDEDGFSSFDLGGIYRMGQPESNSAHIIYDVLVGLKFGGSSHVRTPGYADSTYYAGLRFGRQWQGVTLAATVQSNWIFDKTRGMAYIDFTPEIYFRLGEDWRIGSDFVWRKSTNEHYDEEWLSAKLVRQFGRTQYIGKLGYEFEKEVLQVGLKVNILF